MTDSDQHQGHQFQGNPILYLPLKRMLDDYQKLESIGSSLRESRMPYSEARTYFLKHGIGETMSPKEYYNLVTRLVKDIKKDDTAGAHIAVFEDASWKYCLRKQISTWYNMATTLYRGYPAMSSRPCPVGVVYSTACSAAVCAGAVSTVLSNVAH